MTHVGVGGRQGRQSCVVGGWIFGWVCCPSAMQHNYLARARPSTCCHDEGWRGRGAWDGLVLPSLSLDAAWCRPERGVVDQCISCT